MTRSPRWHADASFLLPAIVVAAAAALRLVNLGAASLRTDEIYIISRSGGSLETLFGRVRETVMGAPVEFLLRHLVLGLSTDEFFLRLPDALLGTLTVLLLYRLASRLFDSPTGVVAAGLLAFSRLHIFQSQDARYYALFGFLSVASTICLLEARDRGGWRRWAAYTLTMIVGFYTCYFMAFVALVHALFVLGPAALAASRNSASPGWKGFAVSGLATAVAFAPWALLYRPIPNIPYPPFGVAAALRIWTAEFSSGQGVVEVVFLLLFVVGAASAWKLHRPAALLCLLFVVVPLPVILGLDLRFHYFFAARQMIFALPLFLALVAFGAVEFARSLGSLLGKPAAQPGAVMAGLLVLLTWMSGPAPQSDVPGFTEQDWRGAAAYLLARIEPGDVVVMTHFPLGPPDGDNIEFYLHSLGGEPGSYRSVDPAVLTAADWKSLTAGGRTWCVVAQAGLDAFAGYPPGSPLRNLVEELGAGFTQEATFAGGLSFRGIGVYRSRW